MKKKASFRTKFIILFLFNISINFFAQQKKNTIKPSENFPAHKKYTTADSNSDKILTKAENHKHQLKNNHKKHKKPIKGHYNYINDQFYTKNLNKAQSLDVIIPENRKEDKLPAIVFIHGGGWKKGDKSKGLRVLDPFISSGTFIGVTINYRLTTEAIWPAQIHDCKAAIRWLKANATKFGIDKKNIAVWGTSAGGHLAAMMAVSSNNDELEGSLGDYLKESSTINCAIDGFGPTDFLMKKSVSIIPKIVDNGFEGHAYNVFNLLDDGKTLKEKARKASPIYLIDKHTKPTLIYHGTEDSLVNMEHSSSFIKSCKEKGASGCYLIKVMGLKHELKMPSALKNQILNFLNKYLKGKNVNISDQPVPLDKE